MPTERHYRLATHRYGKYFWAFMSTTEKIWDSIIPPAIGLVSILLTLEVVELLSSSTHNLMQDDAAIRADAIFQSLFWPALLLTYVVLIILQVMLVRPALKTKSVKPKIILSMCATLIGMSLAFTFWNKQGGISDLLGLSLFFLGVIAVYSISNAVVSKLVSRG